MNVTADRTSISPAAGGPGAGRPWGIRAAAGLAVALAAFSASPSSPGHAAASASPASPTSQAALASPASRTARTAIVAHTAPAAIAAPATRAGEASADCPSSLGWQGTCSIASE